MLSIKRQPSDLEWVFRFRMSLTGKERIDARIATVQERKAKQLHYSKRSSTADEDQELSILHEFRHEVSDSDELWEWIDAETNIYQSGLLIVRDGIPIASIQLEYRVSPIGEPIPWYWKEEESWSQSP